MPFDEPDETELIDVSAVADAVADEPSATATRAAGAEATPLPVPIDQPIVAVAPVAAGLRIATIGERFAAFCLDGVLLWLAYWAGVAVDNKVVHGTWLATIPMVGWHGALFHGIFAVCVFLYYIIFEGIFFATPGKLFSRQTIRRADGGLASYLAIVIRNLVRPIDCLPLGVIALCCMEWTRRCQRLGDCIAGTMVIKRLSSAVLRQAQDERSRRSPVTVDQLSGVVRRSIAGVIDLLLVGGLIGGMTLLLTPQRPVFSQWVLVTLPLVPLVCLVVVQAVSGSSPGKWLCGLVVGQENGTPIGVSHAVLRTLFLPLDWLGVGLLAIALSPRRQRIGDAVAGTIVYAPHRGQSPGRWSLRGGIAGLVMVGVVAGVAYAGWSNPTSWWRAPEFRWTFLPHFDAFPDWPAATKPIEPLGVKNFRFAAGGPESKRTPPVFLPGETAFFLFEVHGYTKDANQVWLQQDLVVRYPDHSYGLRQENIIDYKQVVRAKGAIELINNVNLPITAMAGKYTVFVTVRDRLANTQVVTQQEFGVKGDAPPPQPAASAEEIQQQLAPAPALTPAPVPMTPPAPTTLPGPIPEPAPTTLPAPTTPPTVPPATSQPTVFPAVPVPPEPTVPTPPEPPPLIPSLSRDRPESPPLIPSLSRDEGPTESGPTVLPGPTPPAPEKPKETAPAPAPTPPPPSAPASPSASRPVITVPPVSPLGPQALPTRTPDPAR